MEHRAAERMLEREAIREQPAVQDACVLCFSICPADPWEGIRSRFQVPHVPIDSPPSSCLLSETFHHPVYSANYNSHEGDLFTPKRNFNSADHPLVSSPFEGHLYSQCTASGVLTPASLARSPWLSSRRSLNLVPPYCRMGRALSTRVAFPNVSFWGYSRMRHVLQPSKGRCLSLREIPISDELGQRPTEAQSLLFIRRVCDCIHSLWFNLV